MGALKSVINDDDIMTMELFCHLVNAYEDNISRTHIRIIIN